MRTKLLVFPLLLATWACGGPARSDTRVLDCAGGQLEIDGAVLVVPPQPTGWSETVTLAWTDEDAIRISPDSVTFPAGAQLRLEPSASGTDDSSGCGSYELEFAPSGTTDFEPVDDAASCGDGDEETCGSIGAAGTATLTCVPPDYGSMFNFSMC